jgi:membrane protease YdiL (CAAX protease family)
MKILEALSLKSIGPFSPFVQVGIICILLLLAIITQRKEYKRAGKTYGHYPWRVSTFLSSIYEEIIFRGIILFGLLLIVSPVVSVAISSLLFGLWHLKNYKWQTKKQTLIQVLYTGIIFGPIASIITLYTGTIWMAVIFHYIHNLIADALRKKEK